MILVAEGLLGRVVNALEGVAVVDAAVGVERAAVSDAAPGAVWLVECFPSHSWTVPQRLRSRRASRFLGPRGQGPRGSKRQTPGG